MMDLTFDVNEVLRQRLAASLGLESYADIMNYVRQTDVEYLFLPKTLTISG